MSIIVGIDPGSRVTGFGVIQSDGSKHNYITSGCLRLSNNKFPLCLQQIFDSLTEILKNHQPQQAAIEQVFMRTNANSALKLGQARGAALVALLKQQLPVAEYSARQIKKAVVGYGGASKSQVQHMVKSLLNLQGDIQEDAADALAIAICHAQYKIKGLQL